MVNRSVFIDLGYLGAAAIAAPVFLFRAATDPRDRTHLGERLAFYPRRRAATPAVWVHGVSVGEILGARTLVQSIAAARPDAEIILTTTTVTGRRAAQQQYPGRRVFFFPFDLSPVIKRALDRIRPSLILLFELEIWPNLLQAATERGIPVAIVNGRITERSLRRYRAIRGALRPLLALLDPVCVQDEMYAGRFRYLGVDPARIRVTGNLKYDAVPLEEARPDETLAALFDIRDGDWLWVGGSTHPSEERILAETYRSLRARHPRLRLVLAPRHPDRVPEVLRTLAALGLPAFRRSQLATPGPAGLREAVIVLDTIGELRRVYTLARAVFVGGSLIPHGGQNMIEPAALGRAVGFGPHVHNFLDAAEHLLRAGGAFQVRDAVELTGQLERLLTDERALREMGGRAREAVREGIGATRRTMEALQAHLDRLSAAAPPLT